MTRRPTQVDTPVPAANVTGTTAFLTECSNLTTRADITELEHSAQSAARLLKLLASEQRLLILCKLIEQACSVGELSDYIGLKQAATSQHFAKMRAEGLVDTRRDGQTIYYSLKDPAVIRIIQTLCEIYR